MKTIEITSGDQKALFTTKSVTIEGKEYLYSHMTNVIHSSEKHIYTFTYDGEVNLLPYEEKDEKTLNAIFSQVQKLAAAKKAAAPTSEKADANDKPNGADEAIEKVKPEGDSENGGKGEDKSTAAEIASENAEASEGTDESSKSTEEASKDASVKVTDVLGKTKSKKADKKNDGTKAEMEKPEEDPEKKARKNKSIKIFCIIIAVLLVCSLIYYAIFGTKTDPAPTNPNTTESQQYDDIDQLIDDLQ